MPATHPTLGPLGRKIRLAREDLGLSRVQLAAQAEISSRFLADLEAGRANISILRLLAVAKALAIPSDSLLSGDGPTLPSGIALLGLRGAGKTTCGKLLGAAMGIPFVELDDKIQELVGLATSEIFSLHGEGFYRRLAREALSKLASSDQPQVLALPGGLVQDETSFALARRCFTTVWLKAKPEDHMERVLQQGDSRPMAGLEAPMQELRGLLLLREPLYRQAHHVVDTTGGITATMKELSNVTRNRMTAHFIPG